jgi:ribonucleoside-diphosphate reductase alpha chain
VIQLIKDLPKELKETWIKGYITLILCSEITLPTNDERTAVCCLSSVNLEYYDEWKDDPQFIDDLMRMLDNVLKSLHKSMPPLIYGER